MTKKIATQNINEFGGFGDLMASTPDSSERGFDELKGGGKKTPQKRATKGAAAGCKVGYTRHTYVLAEAMIDQVKAVSQYFGMSESASAEQLIQKGLDAIVAVHGKAAVTPRKAKSLFEK